MFGVNVRGAFVGTQACLPCLKRLAQVGRPQISSASSRTAGATRMPSALR